MQRKVGGGGKSSHSGLGLTIDGTNDRLAPVRRGGLSSFQPLGVRSRYGAPRSPASARVSSLVSCADPTWIWISR